jgi:hypothetical protein
MFYILHVSTHNFAWRGHIFVCSLPISCPLTLSVHCYGFSVSPPTPFLKEEIQGTFFSQL